MSAYTIAHSLDEYRTRDVINEEPNIGFKSMFLSTNCLDGLTKCGFQKPSPIQLKAIPLGRCGFDLIVKSKSGTGKTIVFTVVALEAIDFDSPSPQVVILAPTREIAVQIASTIEDVGRSFSGLTVESFIGGFPEKDDRVKAEKCQIAVGAPGRLKSLIKQEMLDVNSVKLLVLDEADKLMEKSFQSDVNEIFQSLPLKKQVIATSATYPDNLEEFLRNYMQAPTFVSPDDDSHLLLGLKQFAWSVKESMNPAIEMRLKNEEILKLLSTVSFTQCIIFTNYQTRAENISISLNRNGWDSVFISGAQTQRKRLETMDKLKKFKCRLLLSTDLTARGIDASNVDLVINYDLPVDFSTYLHRMGRAGRFGSKGVCITLIGGSRDFSRMEKFLGYMGGENLTISKLDAESITNDLWTVDESKLVKISGSIYKDDRAEHLEIKKEVLSMKKVPKTQEKKNPKRKEGLDDEGSETEETDSEEDEDSDSGANKETLSILKSLANEPLVIGRNKEAHSILRSLASGTFDFASMDKKSKDCENKKMEQKVKEDKIDVDKDNSNAQSSTSAILDDTNTASTSEEITEKSEDAEKTDVNEKNENVLDSRLTALAEGTFDFRNIPSPVVELTEEILANGAADDSAVESLLEIEDMNLLDAGSSQKFEKTRKSSELEAENNSKMSKNEIYVKNKGVYEIARTLSNQSDNSGENVENASSSSKKTNANTQDEPKVNLMETCNLFKQAYLCSIEKGNDRFKSLLAKLNQQIMQHTENLPDEPMEEEAVDNPEYEEDAEMQYEEVDPGVEYDENGYENIPNRMVWVPVDYVSESSSQHTSPNLLEDVEVPEVPVPNVPLVGNVGFASSAHFPQQQEEDMGLYSNQHFRECFEECARELRSTEQSFPNVEDFERWYSSTWLKRLEAVRMYVQQNIYIREMSSYQNSKGKF